MINCEPAQAGNRASKSGCRGQCRDNSSERDAMTSGWRACPTSLRFVFLFSHVGQSCYGLSTGAGLLAGWMHGWMDPWLDGCMAGWMHGWMDGCMAGWFMVVVALVAVVVLGGDGWGSEWLHLWLHGWMDAWLDGCMDGWLSSKHSFLAEAEHTENRPKQSFLEEAKHTETKFPRRTKKSLEQSFPAEAEFIQRKFPQRSDIE